MPASAAKPVLNTCFFCMSHPFPRGLFGFVVGGGLLAIGPTGGAFPAPCRRQWLGYRRPPRSQWRVRAGFAPASHHYRPWTLHRIPDVGGSDALRAGLKLGRRDGEPHPHLHEAGRRRRDAPRRYEPRAEDASADRGLRDGRRAQLPDRRGADAAGAAGRVPAHGSSASRTTSSMSAPTSPRPTIRSASGCACSRRRPSGSSSAATRSTRRSPR